jgi:Tol biopolymer transport system component
MNAGSTGEPHWSPDGKWIAFDCTKSGSLDIYAVSIEGGTDRGIYFIGSSAEAVAAICSYDFATQTTRTLDPVHTDPASGLTDGLSASPDGKWLLYAGGIHTSDIMMMDNFR